MANWKTVFGLVLVSFCAAGSLALGQELPLPQYDEPGQMDLPPTPPPTAREELTVPEGRILEPSEPGELIEQFPAEEELTAKSYEIWDIQPSPVESSGTWRRRGLWYASADAVILDRTWNRDDMTLISDNGQTPFVLPIGTNRFLILEGSHPGADAAVRTTLGRFLFRDEKNRDHFAEFTAYGGGDWVEEPTIVSELPGNGLSVPRTMADTTTPFNGSNSASAAYNGRFSSFELNYAVKDRMRRDQMVMNPNGHWSRQAFPSITREFVVGLRYFDLTDILDWHVFDIENNAISGENGQYFIRTDNNLFGIQLGTGYAYETARWDIAIRGKGGVYINDAKGTATLTITNDDQFDFDRKMTEDELSSIVQAGIYVRWHMTPNVSLRGGYEMLYVTSVALAPHQANFIPQFSNLTTSGDPFYEGVTFGVEGFW